METQLKDRQSHDVDCYVMLQTDLVCVEQTALAYFRKRNTLVLEQKSAMDFVTEADRAIEKYIRQELGRVCPDDAVVGEELGGDVGETYWLVDPIDGTSNFLSGVPLWAI